MFKVGQKVVCIEQFTPGINITLPVVGEIYEIAEICYCTLQEMYGLRLIEIKNPKVGGYRSGQFVIEETFFESNGFRPIDTIELSETTVDELLAGMEIATPQPKPQLV